MQRKLRAMTLLFSGPELHCIKPGLRQTELPTITGELYPPHIDRMAKAKGEIRRSAIVPI